jgi:hypothetical protein
VEGADFLVTKYIQSHGGWYGFQRLS